MTIPSGYDPYQPPSQVPRRRPVTPFPPKMSAVKKGLLTFGGVALFAFGFGAGNQNGTQTGTIVTETAPAVTKTAKPVTTTVRGSARAVETKTVTPTVRVAFADGAWMVGRDVKAGRYTTTKEVSGTCYWERRNPAKDGIAGIVANDNVTGGFPTVTLKVGEQFKSMDCGAWRPVG